MKPEILIIDDDLNFIETLKDGLKIKCPDARIIVAKSALTALEILSKNLPSIIILDIQLPDMHGFEFLRILKESSRLKTTPVIFVSAKYTEPADRTEAILMGASSFFSKPVDIEELFEEIKYILDKNRKSL